MPTMEEIAREVGVSKGTVSKALGGAKDISESMRQIIMKKAVEMGYSRALRKANAPRIALFITNIEYTHPDDFGYDLVAGANLASFKKVAEAMLQQGVF